MRRAATFTIVAALCAGGLIAAVIAVSDPTERFTTRDDGADALTEFQEDTTVTALTEAEISRILQDRFADSPPSVRAIAEAILRGATPSADELAAIDLRDADLIPWRPFPQKQPGYRHSLLREATLTGTPEAVDALIAAGADPRVNDDEMPHLAVQRITTGRERAFPDYATGNAILRRWLDAGGDPNVHNAFYGTLGPLLNTVPMNNLEAMLVLLRAGADPWRTVVIRTTAKGTEHRSDAFVTALANAHPISCEVMFRINREGLVGPGPTEETDRIKQEYALAAENYLGATGPENLHYAWLLQRAIGAAYPNIGLTPEGPVAALMAMQVPDGIGGFWLAPGEVRSPDSPEQEVDNERQFGDEPWSAVQND